MSLPNGSAPRSQLSAPADRKASARQPFLRHRMPDNQSSGMREVASKAVPVSTASLPPRGANLGFIESDIDHSHRDVACSARGHSERVIGYAGLAPL